MASGGVVGRAVVQLIGDNSQLRSTMAQSRAMLNSFGTAAQGVGNRAVLPLTQRLRNLATNMDRLGTTALSLGRTLTTYVTLPIIGIGYAAVKSAVDFNRAMTQVRALGGTFFKELGMSFKGVREELLLISRQTAQVPVDLANALYIVSSAGLDASQVMPVLRAAAKGAAVGMGGVVDVASMLTSVLNDFKQDGLGAANAMDVIAEAIRQGKAEPADFALNLGTVAPAAQRAGMSFQDLASAIAVATNAGVQASRAITGLRFLINSFNDPTPAAKEVFANFGLNVGELQAQIAEPGGLLTVLQLLSETFDLTTVAGKEAWSTVLGGVRGRIVADTQITGNLEKIAEIWQQVGESATDGSQSFEKAWERVKGSRAFSFAQAWNDLRLALLDLGKSIMPILTKDIIPAVMDLIEAFDGLPRSTKQIIVWSAAIAAAVGPVLMLAGGLLRLAALLTRGGAGILSLLGIGRTAGAAAGAAGVGGVLAGAGRFTIPALGMGSQIPALGALTGQTAAAGGLTAGASLAGRGLLGTAGVMLGMGIGGTQQLSLMEMVNTYFDAQGGVDGLIPKVQRGIELIDGLRQSGEYAGQVPAGMGVAVGLRRQFGGSPALAMALGQMLGSRPGAFGQPEAQMASTVYGMDPKKQEVALGVLQRYNRAVRQLGANMTEANRQQFQADFVAGHLQQALRLVTDRQTEYHEAVRAGRQQQEGWNDAISDAQGRLDSATGATDDYAGALDGIPGHVDTKLRLDTGTAYNDLHGFLQVIARQKALINLQFIYNLPDFGPPTQDVIVPPGGGPEAMGGILRGRMGFIARRPTYLVGEGGYPTFAGRGAEAVLPLDERGIGILAEAMHRASRRGGGRDGMTVNVYNPKDSAARIGREVAWATRSKGF